MQDSISVATAPLAPLKPNGFRKSMATNFQIFNILTSSQGFATGHTTPSYLALLTAVLAKASSSPATAHAAAAVAAALQEYKASEAVDAAEAEEVRKAKGSLLTRAWVHIVGGGDKHDGDKKQSVSTDK